MIKPPYKKLLEIFIAKYMYGNALTSLAMRQLGTLEEVEKMTTTKKFDMVYVCGRLGTLETKRDD